MDLPNVFDKPSPFAQKMAVLRCPDDMASISLEGYLFEPVGGFIQVPEDKAAKLLSHGCRHATGAELAALQAGKKK